MRIAFAGNPNSGKTTMYNALTGKNERVGNWAGVTIGRKESPIKADYANTTEELVAVDLPGAYSMSPFTPEESITSGYVRDEHPDAIINIVDATRVISTRNSIQRSTSISWLKSWAVLLSRQFPQIIKVCRTLSRRLFLKMAKARRLLICRQRSTCTIKKLLTQKTESVSHS